MSGAERSLAGLFPLARSIEALDQRLAIIAVGAEGSKLGGVLSSADRA